MNEVHYLIFELYWLQWMSEKEISKVMGYRSTSRISAILKENGWPRRSPVEGKALSDLRKRADKAANLRAKSSVIDTWQKELDNLKDSLWSKYGVQECLNANISSKGACAVGV